MAMATGISQTYSYCNVTVAYAHASKGDEVVLKYAFPDPLEF
jgi:tannase